MATKPSKGEGPGKKGRAPSYKERLFECVPFYTTRLVREAGFTYKTRAKIHSPSDAANLLYAYFEDKDREEFLVLLLDTANTVIGIVQTSIGGLAASVVEPRQVFKAAILGNAAAVILAHNHPSGRTEPSGEDVRITRQLVEAGKVMGIPIHDHLIIGDRTHMSLAERGLMS